MSADCLVPSCGRRVQDSSDYPVCGWHLFGVRWHTKVRFLAAATGPEYGAALRQLLVEAQRDAA